MSLSPGFALRASSALVSLPQGGSETITVTGISVSDYAGQVRLTTTTVPSGVSVSTFDPNPLNIPSGGRASSQFPIHIDPNASAGTGTVAIRDTDGTNSQVISLMLLITNSTTSSTSSRPTGLSGPVIPGLTWESIIAVAVIALGVFGIARWRKRRVQSTQIAQSS